MKMNSVEIPLQAYNVRTKKYEPLEVPEDTWLKVSCYIKVNEKEKLFDEISVLLADDVKA